METIALYLNASMEYNKIEWLLFTRVLGKGCMYVQIRESNNEIVYWRFSIVNLLQFE